MRPLTRLFLGIIALAAILAAVSVGLPSHVTVSRSVIINAPETAIFPYLNTLRTFADWSPWGARDPQLVFSYGGPASGPGAQVAWKSSEPAIGTGNMEITKSEPPHHIELNANFNGLEGVSSFDIGPAGSGSKVNWSFVYESGSSPMKRWKAMMLDRFIGAEYQTGLERLKEKVEADRRPTMPAPSALPEGGIAPQAEQPAAVPPQDGAAAPAAAPPAAETPPAAQPNASDAPRSRRRQ